MTGVKGRREEEEERCVYQTERKRKRKRYERERERGIRRERREVMLAVGSKTQKNSVACHGTESTPKIHSPASLSRVRKVARTLQNVPLDTRDDVATDELIPNSHSNQVNRDIAYFKPQIAGAT